MLHGDGDFGSKYGATDVDKAQYKVDVKSQGHGHEDRAAISKYFDVLRAIDSKLVDFVHYNQRELLGTRELSLEAIRGKLNASAKDKYDTQDVLQFTKQTVATRKFDWKSREAIPAPPARALLACLQLVCACLACAALLPAPASEAESAPARLGMVAM
jgi:hypothetical protein